MIGNVRSSNVRVGDPGGRVRDAFEVEHHEPTGCEGSPRDGTLAGDVKVLHYSVCVDSGLYHGSTAGGHFSVHVCYRVWMFQKNTLFCSSCFGGSYLKEATLDVSCRLTHTSLPNRPDQRPFRR